MDDFLYAVEREFDLPVDILWAAWTDPVALEVWYHPTDLSVVPGSVVSDPVEGGAWSVAIDVPAEGVVAYFWGRYTAVAPSARLDHTLAYSQSAEEFAARDDDAPHHLVRIEFENRGFRSWVKFSQFGDLPEAEALRARAGMESYFDSLAAYLTT
jgi:uncharacterized protein YndB with AHSA1/START domain